MNTHTSMHIKLCRSADKRVEGSKERELERERERASLGEAPGASSTAGKGRRRQTHTHTYIYMHTHTEQQAPSMYKRKSVRPTNRPTDIRSSAERSAYDWSVRKKKEGRKKSTSNFPLAASRQTLPSHPIKPWVDPASQPTSHPTPAADPCRQPPAACLSV